MTLKPMDFQALVRSVGDAVIASDASGTIVLWNPAAERMFGYSEVEALGQSLDLITPQRHQQRHWEGYHKSMASGTTKYGSDLLRVPANHKDGRQLSIAFTVSMLFGVDKKVSAVVAVIRDETSRLAEERELKKRVLELEIQLKTQLKPQLSTPAAVPLGKP
jgi:PAS domain S-box-containing protein